MNVYYMNGAGNDFMVMDARGKSFDFEKLSVELCKLMGADGFMAMDVSPKADFKLHFYNADGSRGEICGNGARCICRFAYDMGIAGETMTVETDAGLVPGWRLDESTYRVKLNDPSVLDLHRKGDIAYAELGCPGVPHGVAAYEGDLWADKEALRERMRALRFDPAFPKGANINFYQLLAPGEVRVLTFERGVEDFTLACGTGTGSVACTMLKKGLLPEKYLIAHNPGGTQRVKLETEGDEIRGIFLEGPTEVVSVHTLP